VAALGPKEVSTVTSTGESGVNLWSGAVATISESEITVIEKATVRGDGLPKNTWSGVVNLWPRIVTWLPAVPLAGEIDVTVGADDT
jgi:hypothetical protein